MDALVVNSSNSCPSNHKMNWRIAKTISYVVMAFIAAGLMGFGGINLQDKVFGLIQWKLLLTGGVVFLAWAFNKMLHF